MQRGKQGLTLTEKVCEETFLFLAWTVESGRLLKYDLRLCCPQYGFIRQTQQEMLGFFPREIQGIVLDYGTNVGAWQLTQRLSYELPFSREWSTKTQLKMRGVDYVAFAANVCENEGVSLGFSWAWSTRWKPALEKHLSKAEKYLSEVVSVLLEKMPCPVLLLGKYSVRKVVDVTCMHEGCSFLRACQDRAKTECNCIIRDNAQGFSLRGFTPPRLPAALVYWTDERGNEVKPDL